MSLGLISRLKNTRVDYVCPECARAFDLPFDDVPPASATDSTKS